MIIDATMQTDGQDGCEAGAGGHIRRGDQNRFEVEDKKAESESARYGDRTYVFRVLISSKKRKILSSDISGARIQDSLFVSTRDFPVGHPDSG